MIAARKGLRSLLLLTIVGSIVAPGVAQAAPNAPTVVVYGNQKPGHPQCADALYGCSVVFANSRPYGDDGPHGAIYYVGKADPDVYIDIVVDDQATDTDGKFIKTRVATAPTGSTEAIDGYDAGEFGVGIPSGFPRAGDLNEIQVTNLGVHTANITAGPSSTNDADWGKSTLYITFQAVNPANENDRSTLVTKTITKYAGAPLDTQKPALARVQWPPQQWCQLSGTGAKIPRANQHMGGESNGQCATFPPPIVGAVPDLTWVVCLEQTSQPHKFLRIPGIEGSDNPFRGEYCRTDSQRSVPTGEAALAGTVIDDVGTAYGLASEIASIKLEVFKGTALYRGPFSLTDSTAGMRFGARATYALVQKIKDYEPNWQPGGAPADQLYTWKITATDAWGNSVTATSPAVTVYPY